jgi:hypothetical protein
MTSRWGSREARAAAAAAGGVVVEVVEVEAAA